MKLAVITASLRGVACCLAASLLLLACQAKASKPAQDKAEDDLRSYRFRGAGWSIDHAECPTLRDLQTVKSSIEIPGSSDPWGTPYRVTCNAATPNLPTITSAGPDKKLDTSDDLRASATADDRK